MRNDFESRPLDGLGHETQHNKLQAFKPLDGRAFEIQKKTNEKCHKCRHWVLHGPDHEGHKKCLCTAQKSPGL